MEKNVKPGLSRRVFGWGQNRVRHPFMGEMSREIVKEGGKSALAGIKPLPLDLQEIRKGFRGRYEDGGSSRFRDLVKSLDLTEEDLQTLDEFHRLQRALNGIAGAVAALFGFGLMVLADTPVVRFGGMAFLLFALVFLVGYLRHDFSLWQLRKRQMAGLSSYLSDRFSAPAR